ncbi:MAG: hypothetical protein ACRYG4_23900 [Janthinobacterium lividum]
MMTAKPRIERPLFAGLEFLLKSGLPTPRQGSTVAVDVADKLAVNERIHVAKPAQTPVSAAFDELRELDRKRRRLLAIRTSAPSGSGKSSNALEYQRHVLAMRWTDADRLLGNPAKPKPDREGARTDVDPRPYDDEEQSTARAADGRRNPHDDDRLFSEYA